jgi:hypothetical protein
MFVVVCCGIKLAASQLTHQARSLHSLFAASLWHFGYGMLLPDGHPGAYCCDPDDEQFPPSVVCDSGFVLDCDECAPATLPHCVVCATGLGHFPIHDAHFCASCLLTRRLKLCIWFTAFYQVAPRVGYGSITNDFSVRALGWDDPPAQYEECNLAAIIEADELREDSVASSPGPVLLYSAEGDANFYIWFLEMSQSSKISP